MTEEWRRVRGNPAYAVSNHGRVKRVFPDGKGRPGTIIRQQIMSHGYPVVRIVPLVGETKRKLVHRLVCEAFHGTPPTPKHESAHGDGNRLNARADNLRWATRKENMADCLLHGTLATGPRHGRTTKPERTPRGRQHGHAKLTERQVRAIRAADVELGSGRKLAQEYGVSPALICSIRARRVWKHLDQGVQSR